MNSYKKLSSIPQPRSLRTQHHHARRSSVNLSVILERPPGTRVRNHSPREVFGRSGRILAPGKGALHNRCWSWTKGCSSTPAPSRSSHGECCSFTSVLYLLQLSSQECCTSFNRLSIPAQVPFVACLSPRARPVRGSWKPQCRELSCLLCAPGSDSLLKQSCKRAKVVIMHKTLTSHL